MISLPGLVVRGGSVEPIAPVSLHAAAATEDAVAYLEPAGPRSERAITVFTLRDHDLISEWER